MNATFQTRNFAIPLETNIRQLPLAYRLAIEWLDTQGDNRTRARLESTAEHYVNSTGADCFTSQDLDFFLESAAAICARRFWNFQQ